jgi:hypothetical protein
MPLNDYLQGYLAIVKMAVDADVADDIISMIKDDAFYLEASAHDSSILLWRATIKGNQQPFGLRCFN